MPSTHDKFSFDRKDLYSPYYDAVNERVLEYSQPISISTIPISKFQNHKTDFFVQKISNLSVEAFLRKVFCVLEIDSQLYLSYISRILPDTIFRQFLNELDQKNVENKLFAADEHDDEHENDARTPKCVMKLIVAFKFIKSQVFLYTESMTTPEGATHHIESYIRGSSFLLIINCRNLEEKEKAGETEKFLYNFLYDIQNSSSKHFQNLGKKRVSFDFFNFTNDRYGIGLEDETILNFFGEFMENTTKCHENEFPILKYNLKPLTSAYDSAYDSAYNNVSNYFFSENPSYNLDSYLNFRPFLRLFKIKAKTKFSHLIPKEIIAYYNTEAEEINFFEENLKDFILAKRKHKPAQLDKKNFELESGNGIHLKFWIGKFRNEIKFYDKLIDKFKNCKILDQDGFEHFLKIIKSPSTQCYYFTNSKSLRDQNKRQYREKLDELWGKLNNIKEITQLYIVDFDICPNAESYFKNPKILKILGNGIEDENENPDFQHLGQSSDRVPETSMPYNDSLHQTSTDGRNNESSSRAYDKETNILLLGESGSGKSTFINAFFNYVNMETLSEAEKPNSHYQALIYSKISYINKEDYTSHTVEIGKVDKNECSDVVGQSQTQQARAHEIIIKEGRELLRIIDTPGTNYNPGDTLEPLRDYLKETNEASGVNIRLVRENVFCFDNEAFRYLMIVKDKKKPSHFHLSSNEVRQFEDSWLQSRDASYELIKYVDSLEPMQISDFVTFETAKQSNQEWALRTRETIEQLLNNKVKKLNFEVDIPPTPTSAYLKKHSSISDKQSKNSNINQSKMSGKNSIAKMNDSKAFSNQIKDIDLFLKEIIKLSAKLFNYVRLRAVSVSNDDLEAYLEEAKRTHISYSYVARDKDNLAYSMIHEYEKLLEIYKKQKKDLIQSSRQKNSVSTEDENCDKERLEKILKEAKITIKKNEEF